MVAHLCQFKKRIKNKAKTKKKIKKFIKQNSVQKSSTQIPTNDFWPLTDIRWSWEHIWRPIELNFLPDGIEGGGFQYG